MYNTHAQVQAQAQYQSTSKISKYQNIKYQNTSTTKISNYNQNIKIQALSFNHTMYLAIHHPVGNALHRPPSSPPSLPRPSCVSPCSSRLVHPAVQEPHTVSVAITVVKINLQRSKYSAHAQAQVSKCTTHAQLHAQLHVQLKCTTHAQVHPQVHLQVSMHNYNTHAQVQAQLHVQVHHPCTTTIPMHNYNCKYKYPCTCIHVQAQAQHPCTTYPQVQLHVQAFMHKHNRNTHAQAQTPPTSPPY
jgi:hypothetical protein